MVNNTFASIITPNVALAIFLAILILSLFIAALTNPKYYDLTRTKIFISCLAGLGIFVTFMFYYSIVTLQQAQQRLEIITLTSHINKVLTKGFIDEIQKAQHKIPHFVMSLFPLSQCYEIENDQDCPEHCLLKYNLSYKIFSLWQELLIATPFLDLDQQSYLCHFLQRANSQQLYNQWIKMKMDFNLETQEFGDLLFQHGLKINERNGNVYLNVAKKVLCHPIYKKLMKN
jgi:hypothetical protein